MTDDELREILRLAEAATPDRCDACGGYGYVSIPEHAPGCDGSCSSGQCPIERREPCEKCPEPLVQAYQSTVKAMAEELLRARELLSEMAADFERWCEGIHDADCNKTHIAKEHRPCDCGLDAARAKWRLPK